MFYVAPALYGYVGCAYVMAIHSVFLSRFVAMENPTAVYTRRCYVLGIESALEAESREFSHSSPWHLTTTTAETAVLPDRFWVSRHWLGRYVCDVDGHQV